MKQLLTWTNRDVFIPRQFYYPTPIFVSTSLLDHLLEEYTSEPIHWEYIYFPTNKGKEDAR